MLSRGDPAPVFRARSNINPDFAFSSAAGRYLVLTFVPSTAATHSATLLRHLANRALFDTRRAALFIVSQDPEEPHRDFVYADEPGIRLFYDDGRIAALYGVADPTIWPVSFVISPRLQLIHVIDHRIAAGGGEVLALLQRLPHPADLAGELGHAPVLIIPDIFETDLCRTLIRRYLAHGGQKSGFMRDVDGRTVELADPRHKVREDWMVDDPQLKQAIQERINRRVVPEIAKAFQFGVTRLERYLVACYDATDGGHFGAHRDNTTKGTAHRRFAVSVNLNAEDYEGGDLRLPEFGSATYRAPTGGGVVFSCSLLHQATPVTKGKRYAFLPFLYDEAARAIRDANMRYLGRAPG